MLPRMRSIKQALEMIKAEDENTCISEYYIRSLCKQNKIKHIRTGVKELVDFDDLLRFIKEASEG